MPTPQLSTFRRVLCHVLQTSQVTQDAQNLVRHQSRARRPVRCRATHTTHVSKLVLFVAAYLVGSPPVWATVSSNVLVKSFTPSVVAVGAVSRVKITIGPNAMVPIASAAITDNLPSTPSQMRVAPVPNAVISGAPWCASGSLSAAPGSTSVTYTPPAAALIEASNCLIAFDVVADMAGTYVNALPAGAITYADSSVNNSPAAASLTVTNGISISKHFSRRSIGLGEATALFLVLTNAFSTPATLTAPLIDNLPPGLVVAPQPDAYTTCNSGSVTAVAAASVVQLAAGAVIPPGASCVVAVQVTANGTSLATRVNSIPPNSLVTNLGANFVSASADLAVSPPTAQPTCASPAPALSWANIALLFVGVCAAAIVGYRRR